MERFGCVEIEMQERENNWANLGGCGLVENLQRGLRSGFCLGCGYGLHFWSPFIGT